MTVVERKRRRLVLMVGRYIVDVEDERAVVGGDKTGVGTWPRLDDNVAVLTAQMFVCWSSRVSGPFPANRTIVKVN